MNKPHALLILGSVVVFASLSACAIPLAGKPLDPTKVEQVKEGKTTEDQLVGLLGSPNFSQETVVLGGWKKSCGKKGDSIRMVSYTAAKAEGNGFTGYTTKNDTLSFYVNDKGVVCKKSRQAMNIQSPGAFGMSSN